MKLRLLICAITLGLSFGVFAQGLSSEAQQALAKGAQAAAQALATYDQQLLDKPLWRDAINYGLEAQRLAPNSPEPYRFLGQVYSTVAFYGRAYESWTRYLELGGILNPQTTRYLIEASQWMGSAAFENKQYEDAIKYYTTLHDLKPESEEANQHLALSYQAIGKPEKALPYLQTLASTLPERSDYGNLYEITQEQSTYGVEASKAYRTGLDEYNAGQKSEALASFRQAVQLNNNFENALLYAARTSLELGFSSESVTYWNRLLVLSPGNSEAIQALATAEGQAKWGAGAYSSFNQGVTFYQQGRYPEAQQAFMNATTQNPRYEDAWSYLGKIALQSQDYASAISHYTSALNLSPANTEYTTQLTQARSELERLAEEERQKQLAEEEARKLEEEKQKQLAEEERQKQLAAQEAARRQAEAEAAAQQEEVEPVEPVGEPEPAEPEPVVEPEPVEPEPIVEPEPVEPEPIVEPEPVEPEPVVIAEPVPPVGGGSQPTSAAVGGPVVLLDISYTHQDPDKGGTGAFSFFKSPPGLAGNLSSFPGGMLYQRVKVLSKPSNQLVNYQICLVHAGDISVGPACASLDALSFTEAGVYESNQPIGSLSNAKGVDWSRGLSEVMLVVKDGSGNAVDDRYSYRSEEPLDLSQFYPMEVAYTAILVPEGSSFPGWP